MSEYDLFLKLLDDDMINFNALLIKYYKRLKINEKDVMVLSSLAREEMRGYGNFNPQRLKNKVALDEAEFFDSLSRLESIGYIVITTAINPKTSKEYELFSLKNLYKKIVELYSDIVKKEENKKTESFYDSISSYFETLFLRPMSPLDADVIRRWNDEKLFTLENIKSKMADAAKIGKTSLSYVDSLLIKEKVMREQSPEYKEANQVINELKERWKK